MGGGSLWGREIAVKPFIPGLRGRSFTRFRAINNIAVPVARTSRRYGLGNGHIPMTTNWSYKSCTKATGFCASFPMSAPRPFSWSSAASSETGAVRRINEDALLERPDIGLWVVADGMGGHDAGNVASQLIVECLDDFSAGPRLGNKVERLEARLTEVNQRLRNLSTERGVQTIGSTVAVLLIHDSFALCLWAGDSRIYRFRDGRLKKLVQDHTLVEEMVQSGLLGREEADKHPQANIITRAIGAMDPVYLDMEIYELRDRDIFLLCSDGLDKEVEEDEVAAVIARTPIPELANSLTALTLSRGARDNTTVIGLQVHENCKLATTAGAQDTRGIKR